MAEDMDAYLKSETLYWQLGYSDMPKLTLGGFLLRRHRLLNLAVLMDEDEWLRMETAVAQFIDALSDQIVRSEQRAHEEIQVRIRQWGTYLNDVQKNAAEAAVNYATAVENRAMIAALGAFLQTQPFQLEAGILERTAMLDTVLSKHWQAADFIWPAAWQTTYPPTEFWWLYGRPK
jgi:hypothetical protein